VQLVPIDGFIKEVVYS